MITGFCIQGLLCWMCLTFWPGRDEWRSCERFRFHWQTMKGPVLHFLFVIFCAMAFESGIMTVLCGICWRFTIQSLRWLMTHYMFWHDLNLHISMWMHNSLLHNLRYSKKIWKAYDKVRASGNHYTSAIPIDAMCRQSMMPATVEYFRENECNDDIAFYIASFNTLISGFVEVSFKHVAQSFFLLDADAYSYKPITF